MKVFDLLKNKALEEKKTIVLPEGNDDRILTAASKLLAQGIVNIILLGKPEQVNAKAKELDLDLTAAKVIDPDNYDGFEQMCNDFVSLRKGKNTIQEAQEMLKDVSYFGTMLVYEGQADGMVSGAVHSTADTVRPALQIIKTKPGMHRVSGSMIMERDNEKYIFADCAINIDPDSETLAEIAYQSAKTAQMVNIDPQVAMLSFSTKGSARGEMIDKVKQAVDLVNKNHPEIACDGELQFDAAFVPSVAASKAPDSKVAGHANVFIFPELQSGNISYKVAQRLGNFAVIGPVLQGLAAPINDLSRGCTIEDAYLTIVLTAAQANADKD
ncbi:phosphate acetyltransferase [Lactobacillus colini]|uniref:Phosphate acetyltransferase n=1 Tax=Lactobacillus colini TaxID=1819254 RepID=A0ABS4MDE0_9LACO|nr:phosphate acetyltransferase [Lactobacillus colini]MBP2057698.1 phosphate acetyltransferase [Lactobacillus colini]